ncbi:hypothetical protein [Faecalibacterium sp. I4-1-79]|nr:hypothetical protein [Faecalibacterium sp. I4-1-79]UQK40022.1 hypothetical protein MTP36_14715 [Faecalibacterium sp. I4-1-79]
MNGLEKQNRLHPVYHTGRRGGNLFTGMRGKIRGGKLDKKMRTFVK